MDRTIVYPGSIPLDTDVLQLNRNTMVAFGALIQAVLGSTTVVSGLAVSPTTPNSLAVSVGPGSITAAAVVDTQAFGSLAADSDPLMKMGINLEATTLTLAATATAGQSVAWLIEAAFVETDTDPIVLPYYNAANPTQPWLGPNNNGGAQPTARVQQVQLQARAGVPAQSGSQVPPAVDPGWVGLAVVTVAYGQTAIDASAITPLPGAPLLSYALPQLRPGFSTMQVFATSGAFVVPNGVSMARVTVIGGGGAGGTHSTLPGGGGGAGGRAMGIVTGLIPGSTIAVTVGAGGLASATPAAGGPGGTSSFGTFLSATGGSGGGGGTASQPNAGGAGGVGVGGEVNEGGSFGTDCVIQAAKGGDGGGPGGGRGSTGALAGITATGPGGGGGGGGCSQVGGGVGSSGANGASGLVIVEY